MQVRDIYKLLYQSVRGPEHIIVSPEAFNERLVEEWNALDLTEIDPLWELIRPDGSLLRVNLCPFKAAGGSLDALAVACLETGRHPWGAQEELKLAWYDFVTACREGDWPNLAIGEVESFSSWLDEKGFPPVHHSDQYRSLYRPAYRLVADEVRKHCFGRM